VILWVIESTGLPPCFTLLEFVRSGWVIVLLPVASRRGSTFTSGLSRSQVGYVT
jgi:hypothetical protein